MERLIKREHFGVKVGSFDVYYMDTIPEAPTDETLLAGMGPLQWADILSMWNGHTSKCKQARGWNAEA